MSKKYTNYSEISTKEKKEEEVKVENSPEEKIEEIVEEVVEKEPEPEIRMPENATLLANVYVRETPYGDKVDVNSLDRFLSAKTIRDTKGSAIVPKGSRVTVYDVFAHEDGSKWFNTEFGYLMAMTKDGKELIK